MDTDRQEEDGRFTIAVADLSPLCENEKTEDEEKYAPFCPYELRDFLLINRVLLNYVEYFP